LGNATNLYQRSLPELGVGLLFREIMSNCGVGSEAAEFLITARESDLAAEHERSSRWQWIAEQIRQYADSLADEARASLAYAAHRYSTLPIRSLRLAGGGAGVRGLGELLGERLGIDSRQLTAADLSIVNANSGQPTQPALLALAMGLARREED
jgi:Tfp pilus assembly PilM family ATPase